ncbi:MAG: xanthine dehydrogenase family protein subunit M [Syntrophobacter sp.]
MRKVFVPASLDEVWRFFEDNPGATVYTGGTDLLVRMYKGALNPESLICLDRIKELKGVHDMGEEIRIGACSTHTEMLGDPLVSQHLPVLRRAIEVIGSPLIRNMGTIGGNICTASPAGDTLPPLYALQAEVELCSKMNVKRMPIRDFIGGPGSTCLRAAEIVSAVWVKKPVEYNLQHFEKVGQRNALACSVVSLAAVLRIAHDGVVEKAALAWGSVGPTVITCPEAEEALVGGPLSRIRVQVAASLARQAVRPISDIRGSEDYRRSVAGNLLMRLISAD